jgi:two-component system, chemotaxis family, sensor kinase CheA
MDVVKTNIEKIGGVVELQSTPAQGTTVHVKIPLTLAIVPALVVRCCGERFAIPQVSLTELVRCEAGKGIESVHGSPVYRLRGQILPLIYLTQVLKPAKRVRQSCEGEEELMDVAKAQTVNLKNVNIAVLQADGQHFGLVVDDILDTQEIVVKPLAKQLKGISAYAGATIMGDGRVALILDVMGLAEQAKVMNKGRESLALENDQETQTERKVKNDRALLIAQNGAFGRVAIPLSLVSRLEVFPATAVERAGRQEVMQYRGHIIPVVKLWDVLADGMDAYPESRNKIQVVIYSEKGHTVGLIVDQIIDIVHEYGALEALAPRPGVAGTFVAQQQVTELLDVPAIVKGAVPGVVENPEAAAAAGI